MVINPFKSTITIYDTLEVMPLINFQKYLETRDLKYFTKEHKDHPDLKKVMNKLFGLYLARTSDHTILNRFGIMHNILKYTGKYNTVMLLIQALYDLPQEEDIKTFRELIKQLEEWNYKINPKKEIFDQLNKIYTRAQGIKTKIALYEEELAQEDDVRVKSIQRQIIEVTRVVGLNYPVNYSTITLLEWIELQEIAEESIKERQKAMKK